MVLGRISPLDSGSFHNMTEFTAPHGHHYRSTSRAVEDHRPQASFNEGNSTCSPETYAHTPASTAADLAFNPWLLELPPHASPLSRTSSLSGSENIATPPPFMEHPSVYHMVDDVHQQASNYMMRDSSYIQNQELTWQPHVSQGCASLPPASHATLHAWHGNNYGGPPMPPMDYYAHQFTGSPAVQPYNDNLVVLGAQIDEMQLEASTVANASDSTVSDSDSEDSEYEDDASSYSQSRGSQMNSGSSHTDSHATPFLRLGRWGALTDPYNRPAARNYPCTRVDQVGNHERQCERSFARPEHLRRHVRTVPGELRPYVCKVPRCSRAFSRGDNLRDHYWTHLERGGRAGKNNKMSLAELKAILGKEDKRLVRRLKHRLVDTQAKQRAESHGKIRSKL
jgi:hypothetical protein